MTSLKRSIDESTEESTEESTKDESSPSVSKQPRLENNDLVVALGIRKGERPEMQDRHSIHKQVNCGVENIERSLLLCLFDGHAGFQASEYCNQNFPRVFSELCQKYSEKSQDQLEKNMKKIFTETYKKVDDSFLVEARKACVFLIKQNSVLEGDTFRKPALKDGSTGTTIFVLKNTVYSANIGDSQAFLCRKKSESELSALQLTADHSPINFEERSRIQKAGGSVSDGRLLGILEVSRAFGDGQLKAHGLISVPAVKKLTLTDSDLFIVCGSDGIWKVFKPLEALEFVHQKFLELRTQKSLEDIFNSIANSLAEDAVKRRCGDNVSVVIVVFIGNLSKL